MFASSAFLGLGPQSEEPFIQLGSYSIQLPVLGQLPSTTTFGSCQVLSAIMQTDLCSHEVNCLCTCSAEILLNLTVTLENKGWAGPQIWLGNRVKSIY